MVQKYYLTDIFACICGAVCVAYASDFVFGAVTIIAIVTLACLLALHLLLSVMLRDNARAAKATRYICIVLYIAMIIAMLIYITAYALPFVAVLVTSVVFDVPRLLVKPVYAWLCSIAAIAVLAFVSMPYAPDAYLVVVSVFCFVPVAAFLTAIHYLEHANMQRDVQHERADRAAQLLVSQRELARDIQRDVASDERRRISARIHDELGHGYAGSIMTLEAALAVWDTDNAKAKDNVGRAVENLRFSVNGIRDELHGERSSARGNGLDAIANELHDFQRAYGIRTHMDTSGALANVPSAIWTCVSQNLKETLTNTLKYAKGASAFNVGICMRAGVLEVEFRDNGDGAGDTNENVNGGKNGSDGGIGSDGVDDGTATGAGYAGGLYGNGDTGSADVVGAANGMGLANIQERCLFCGGHATFDAGPHGFITKMVFNIRGAYDR
ncbi:MAG: histidine kinase [Coriobacteriales bacterium]|jgi:signal transduction histidine kinase|nr:histidine kinase [Coriobacteriales bacterium]